MEKLQAALARAREKRGNGVPPLRTNGPVPRGSARRIAQGLAEVLKDLNA